MSSLVPPLIQAFRTGVLVMLALLPVPLVLHMQATGTAALRFEHHRVHEGLVALSILLAGFITYVTWLCYRHSREPFLRYLTLAFLAFAVVYAPHGLLTSWAHQNPFLFLLYGPASRLAMAILLVAAVLHWGAPAEPSEGGTGRWLPWVAGLLALTLSVGWVATTPFAPMVRIFGESGTITLSLAAAAIMGAKRLRGGLVGLYLATMALFAQACWAFMVATPWSHLWWTAHGIFCSGFLLLSTGVARAYLSTRSFTRVYSERDMVAQVAAAAAEAEAANAHAEQLRRMFAAKPVGVVVLDRDGRRLFENQRAAELAGRVAEPGGLLAPLLPLVRETAQAENVALKVDGGGGGVLHLTATWAPFAYEGIAATIVWLYDVTRLKAALEEAERANAAKSRFLAAASHDIRQPLVPIKLFAELLQGEVSDSASYELVQKMRSSLQSLDDLLSRLLDFSRLEAGTVHAKTESVHMGPVLARLRNDFEPVAKAKGLSLRVIGSRAVAHTDRVLLEQILRNLIENALRYTAQGKVVVGCRRRGSQLRLLVGDTGIGIPADKQQAVFGEFFQIGNDNRNRRQGLGLGLATVDRLCRLLGHPLELKSEVGRGSVFTVTMPLDATGTPRSPLRFKPRSLDCGALRVLLIEDDDEAREAVAIAMAKWGWQISTAASCADALASVEENGPPDVIVTDLRLEAELSGLDAIQQIAEVSGSDIPAVIITGDNHHPDLTEAMTGPWPLQIKPFSAQQLRNAIAEALTTAGHG